MSKQQEVVFLYKNHKGEVELRHVEPISLLWGNSPWHSEEQWLMHGYDLKRAALRTYAMKDISDWRAFDSKVDDSEDRPVVAKYRYLVVTENHGLEGTNSTAVALANIEYPLYDISTGKCMSTQDTALEIEEMSAGIEDSLDPGA